MLRLNVVAVVGLALLPSLAWATQPPEGETKVTVRFDAGPYRWNAGGLGGDGSRVLTWSGASQTWQYTGSTTGANAHTVQLRQLSSAFGDTQSNWGKWQIFATYTDAGGVARNATWRTTSVFDDPLRAVSSDWSLLGGTNLNLGAAGGISGMSTSDIGFVMPSGMAAMDFFAQIVGMNATTFSYVVAGGAFLLLLAVFLRATRLKGARASRV